MQFGVFLPTMPCWYRTSTVRTAVEEVARAAETAAAVAGGEAAGDVARAFATRSRYSPRAYHSLCPVLVKRL